MGKRKSGRILIGVRPWLVGAILVTVTLIDAGMKPDEARAFPAGQEPAITRPSSQRRPPPQNPSIQTHRIKQDNLIERVLVDDPTPDQFQEVLVRVMLKPGVDASKAVILIAGKPGNPRIVRFFEPGEDRIRAFVAVRGRFDIREESVRVGKASQLATTALLEVKPYAFRANTVEFRVVRAPRDANTRFTWAFGDGQRAITNVPWTTHSYPASAVMKTYQVSVSFIPGDVDTGDGAVAAQGRIQTPAVRPRRPVTLRETVVRLPRPARVGSRSMNAVTAASVFNEQSRVPYRSSGSGGPQRRQTKLKDYAVGYEVYQAMKVLRKRQVTIEDLYRLKQEEKIRAWVPRRADAGNPGGRIVPASYVEPQEGEDLDRLAEELFGPGYEFQYVPGRMVNARKGDIYLIHRVDVPGVTAMIQALGQSFTHGGILVEDQYTVRDMSADGKSPFPRKAGELFRGSETDFSDPFEKVPYRLNPILLRQQAPGIRERSVDEAIVHGSLPLDTAVIVKPLPANEAEDRPRVEAVADATRLIESSVGLPGVLENFYKLYAFTDGEQMGMCSSYIWTAAGSVTPMPVFDYSPALRRSLAHICYEDTRDLLFREALKISGTTSFLLQQAGLEYLSTFARNGANQIVNTFGWDESYNLSHDWVNFTDEELGWSRTVSPDNMRPRWFDVELGAETEGWGRPWGYEEPLQYELGSYRAVRRDGSDLEATGPTTAGRFKLVLHRIKCFETEEATDEIYLKIRFRNSAGRVFRSFTTRVYRSMDDDVEKTFRERDRDNMGWINIGDGVSVEVELWEQDGVDSPDDKLGSSELTIRTVPIPVATAVVIGEPPGRRHDDLSNWTFERTDPNPFVSDWKYKVWFQTIYAPTR